MSLHPSSHGGISACRCGNIRPWMFLMGGWMSLHPTADVFDGSSIVLPSPCGRGWAPLRRPGEGGAGEGGAGEGGEGVPHFYPRPPMAVAAQSRVGAASATG